MNSGSGHRAFVSALLGLLAVGFLVAEARGEQGGRTEPKLDRPAAPPLGSPPTTGEFAVTKQLRPAVDFWKLIFARYGGDEAVVHHMTRLGIVYSALDLSDLKGHPRESRLRRSRINGEIERVRAILRKLQDVRSPDSLTAEDRRIYDSFGDVPGRRKFLDAARRENIHVQSGIRDRFERGLVISRKYLPEIERIFREEGVPLQITRLPLVESSFDVRAHSSAGAAGIWQFIRSTGRLYMKVGRAVDERRDPLIASRGAAKLLKYNHRSTGSWPLAITAYNHGLGGVMRAIRVTGSRDMATIIRRYRSRSFGYASRNFFVELLAALEVERDYRRHFGELRFQEPFGYDAIRLRRAVLSRHLIQAGMSREELADYNPALTSRTLSSRLSIPSGTILRTRVGQGDRLVEKLNALRVSDLPRSTSTGIRRHRVRRGESLSSVARRYGVRRTTLARANGLSSRAHLRIGQVLKVPVTVRTTARNVRSKRGGATTTAVFLHSTDPTRVAGRTREAPEAPVRVVSKDFDATALVLEGEAGGKRTGGPVSAPDDKQRTAPPHAASLPGKTAPPPTEVKAAPTPMAPLPSPATPPPVRVEPPPAPVAPPPVAPPPPLLAAEPAKPLSSPGAVHGVPSTRVAEKSPAPEKKKKAVRRKASRSSRGTVHVVRRNETLWKIARKNRVSLRSLKAANAGKRLTPLMPGTRLQISGSGTHVVKRHETLWGIAKRYRVSLSRLKRANAGKRLSPLIPGTRLRIPG
jgi:membrane-bound lytic murein transglycosylase D